jgi:nucleoid-associated protein YgaU
MMRWRFLSKPQLMPRREILLLAGFALVAGLALISLLSYYKGRETVSQPITAPRTAAAPGPIEPGFDVIRVTRDGRAVMAGRASPGARVSIKSGDQLLGEVTADTRGDWVIILETPLKPGAQVLSLHAQLGQDGPVLSKDSAVISVPEQQADEVFVAVSRPGKATRILNQGHGEGAAGVAVAGIDLAPKGGAVLSGRAEGGRLVRIYLDNQPVGEAAANQAGDWELEYKGVIGPGEHKLRGDQLDHEGDVVLRAEVTFSRAKQGALVMGAQQVVVMQGNALWEIARNIYGSGIAYSVIFTGNKQQIRNPDLIYPGQIFDIPSAPSAAAQETMAPTVPDTNP